jgi:hypothetical protein
MSRSSWQPMRRWCSSPSSPLWTRCSPSVAWSPSTCRASVFRGPIGLPASLSRSRSGCCWGFWTSSACAAHLAFTCVNALVAAALASRAPERLTLGQLLSVDEYRRWAARIDLKVAGASVLATPGLGQALMAAAPSLVAEEWSRGVSRPGADVEAYATLARRVYRQGGSLCLAALEPSMNATTAADVGPPSVPTTFLLGRGRSLPPLHETRDLPRDRTRRRGAHFR